MNKKSAKTKRNSEHTLAVVLEDVNSKLDLVLEGHQMLEKKIVDTQEEVRELHKEMDYKFDIVIDELHIIKDDLKQKVDRSEFVVLEKRVRVLEKAQSR